MSHFTRPRATRGTLLAIAAVSATVAVLCSTLQASAHASIPSSAAFGFLPNTAGGTGAPGSTPPYVPGSSVTIALRVPFEQTEQHNGADDTTVDIKTIVPSGWTNATCVAAKTQINNPTTNNTNQPGADVAGWSCEVLDVAGHQVLHWSGPQVASPQKASDSVQFVLFNVTVPTPAEQTTYNGKNGTEGFIVDQVYASGEAVHWIPDDAFPGTVPTGAKSIVASGLVRTVGGPGTDFHPLAPSRILDSRNGTGGWTTPLTAGTTNTLTVTGAGHDVPAGADAVVLNVTATDPSTSSFLTVYPGGSTAPTTSNLNFVAGQSIPNLVVVKLPSSGQVAFTVGAGSVDVIADLVGYFSAADGDLYNSVVPARLLDSRGPIGGWNAPLVPGTPKTLAVQGHDGVSATADAVILNVTATDATADGFLTVYPAGGTQPGTSNLNFVVGKSSPNLVIAKVGTNGEVAFAAGEGSVNVIADVVGYFDPNSGDEFHSVAPSRILDSRSPTGGFASTPLAAGPAKTLTVPGFGGVRADATAVFANTTVTEPTADGFLTVYPDGATTPPTSNLNFVAGETVPNLVAVGIGSAGNVAIANSAGTTHVIVDVVGYFTPGPAPV
jgi:hypothetical protein